MTMLRREPYKLETREDDAPEAHARRPGRSKSTALVSRTRLPCAWPGTKAKLRATQATQATAARRSYRYTCHGCGWYGYTHYGQVAYRS